MKINWQGGPMRSSRPGVKSARRGWLCAGVAAVGLTAVAGPAPVWAQSEVSLSGAVDASVGRDMGKTDRSVRTGTQGRGTHLTLAGAEALGNGLKAGFVIRQEIFLTGDPTDSIRLRDRYVYLESDRIGRLSLGTRVRPGFTMAAAADPFMTDGVAANSEITSMAGVTSPYADSRASRSVTFETQYAGAFLALQVADKAQADDAAVQVIPVSAALGWRNDDAVIGVGYDRPGFRIGNATSEAVSLSGRYNLGAVTLHAGVGRAKGGATSPIDINAGPGLTFAKGDVISGQLTRLGLPNGYTVRSALLGVTWRLGAFELLASYGILDSQDLANARDRIPLAAQASALGAQAQALGAQAAALGAQAVAAGQAGNLAQAQSLGTQAQTLGAQATALATQARQQAAAMLAYQASNTQVAQRLALGVRYNLSARTSIYANAARDPRQPSGPQTAYELGVRHRF
ncbi:porin [Amphibiibacter pelophylacis]|uniref:Porin n=1 Tax=Amphibiibacter pelophylacis TaxID=1799477 RepID=A0ACC6P435_9BURK